MKLDKKNYNFLNFILFQSIVVLIGSIFFRKTIVPKFWSYFENYGKSASTNNENETVQEAIRIMSLAVDELYESAANLVPLIRRYFRKLFNY